MASGGRPQIRSRSSRTHQTCNAQETVVRGATTGLRQQSRDRADPAWGPLASCGVHSSFVGRLASCRRGGCRGRSGTRVTVTPGDMCLPVGYRVLRLGVCAAETATRITVPSGTSQSCRRAIPLSGIVSKQNLPNA